MTDMIEYVARAIAKRRGLSLDRTSVTGQVEIVPGEAPRIISMAPDPQWLECLADARAAIEAMREPTGAMTGAGAAAMDSQGHHDCEVGPDVVWHDMIDAALAGAA